MVGIMNLIYRIIPTLKKKVNMRVLTSLPDQIILKNGIVLKMLCCPLDLHKQRNKCKLLKIKYRTIYILAKGFRGVTDLHGNTYKPGEWLFVDEKMIDKNTGKLI